MTLKYTGHPLYDIGVATIAAFTGRSDPAQVTEDDLTKVADYIAREYTRNPLKSFLTVAFPNSGFTQPAFEKTPERREEYARRVLRNYGADAPILAERCVFTGEPAVATAFGDKEGLPLGRAFRQHIPLVTGEEIINFHPYGDAGIPVSGKALLAIQAFPLGCAKVAGRLLAVHSDNEELTLHFAASFLTQNRRLIQLAQQAGSSKLEEARYSQRTLLVDTLMQVESIQNDDRQDDRPFSVTAYHLTNLADKVDLDIYYLPLQVTGFLREMLRADNRNDWSVIVQRAWRIIPPKKGGKGTRDFPIHQNDLYDDLFALPGNAHYFLRKYFLGRVLHTIQTDRNNRQDGYSSGGDASPVSWKITARFLRRIMNMEKDRIEAIRDLGDRLADYVSRENDRRFFRDFFTERRYDYFRTALIKANIAHVRHGNPPLITLDPYINVFEEGEGVERLDWRFARDLVLIRMIEQLHYSGWLGAHADALPDETEETADEAV